MIVEIKTIEPLVIDLVTLKREVVYMQIMDVVFDGEVMSASLRYVTKKENTLENGDTELVINKIIKHDVSSFTRQEIDGLEIALSITGDTLFEKYQNLIAQAALHIAGERMLFGLDRSGFVAVQNS